MVDLEKVKGWVGEYVRLKRLEAKKIEELYGPGDISDVKFQAADEAEAWLKSNPTEFDEPVSASYHSTPDNFKISDVFPEGCYMEYTYADGTIRRVCTFKKDKK